ncbi:Gcd10p-domain-containing protein [Trichodelitschia bisporula]|uniref:tRNA (adenine(58)-N(1))-methyltransferase non-catalytic subunit TRM6 n=1 Tax=Trichodelitschia bisporula TaxID=703511 RepID=A0A6G1I7A4_9PEZI|nr:Gcd10p-domain-containing protein [Trichodelitschia bisporula]
MQTHIRSKDQIVLALPSGLLKILEIQPHTNISIGKFGTFSANLLLGRPYHFTYEILDQQDGQSDSQLRVVPPSELNAESLADVVPTPNESRDEKIETDDGCEFEIVGENGEVIMRNNRLTIDDPSRQALTMEEIEELKKASTGSGKEIVAKIMAAHSALEEKTSFSLAKYTLRKTKKYIRRFTVLPLDVGMLSQIMLEKDPWRIMELREETLGLIASWANIHHSGFDGLHPLEGTQGAGRWLVLDDTGGLVVAALAERMGILYPTDTSDDEPTTSDPTTTANSPEPAPRIVHPRTQSATNNTLTLLHSNAQPNISLLKHFGYVFEDPSPTHPLHTHLKTLTWLQLLDPTADQLYREPPTIPDETLATLKSGKRGAYHRKRRRWERVKRVADETAAGDFDGLVMASHMQPAGVLAKLLPLLRRGAPIVVFSPTVEPLTELMDLFSRERKAAFVRGVQGREQGDGAPPFDEADFPVNPTLVLNPMLQTARAREWQVLPHRTHPMMTSKGGAEGFLFTGTRVEPAEGRVEARGKFQKRRKVAAGDVSGAVKEANSALKEADEAIKVSEMVDEGRDTYEDLK